jgi:GNAT superfamily N-acetyltransferase
MRNLSVGNIKLALYQTPTGGNREAELVTAPITIRPLTREDRAAWEKLWAGYNAFYGRQGPTALPQQITDITWERIFDPSEPVHALVADAGGELVGLTHYLFHRSTTALALSCYLQDLFTSEAARGQGVGRALIEGVYASAKAAGSTWVYWQTHETNRVARTLYDQVAAHSGFIVYGKMV